jgi:hypothetical protein
MLYVSFSDKGHYEGDTFIQTPITPVLPMPDDKTSRILPNGCFEADLDIKYANEETNEDKVTLAKPSGDTVWILAQDSTFSWTNRYAGYYGSKKGEVSLVRPRDTDMVIVKMGAGSWFVSNNVIYHNDGGVLVKYSTESVIGWSTWDSPIHNFIDPRAVGYTSRHSAEINAAAKSPCFCDSPRIYF